MELKLNLPRLLSKVILIVLASIGAGIALHNSNEEDYKRGVELTLEKYTAGYQAYKEDLMDDAESPIATDLAIMVILGGFFFIFYELVAWLLSLPIRYLFNRFEQPREVRDLIS